MVKLSLTTNGEYVETVSEVNQNSRKKRGRKPNADSVKNKTQILKMMRDGLTIAEACRHLEIHPQTVHYYRKSDQAFKNEYNRIKDMRTEEGSRRAREEIPDFPEFSKDYLDTQLFWHQLQWYDLLEGRDPRDLHPAQHYHKGDPGMVIVNTPPEHAKALALDTEVLTDCGWSSIGGLRNGDRVFGPDGKPTTVVGKSEVFDKPCSRVGFNHGESFTASDDHLWTVVRSRREVTVTTRELRHGDRLPFHGELHMEGAQYDLDPYLLGCWLGDGHTASGRFTSADAEIVEAFAGYAPRECGKYTYETTGLFRQLAELGLIGRKEIPAGYMLGHGAQRLALLQGLMDTDGTISARGQASFTSTNKGLAEGVLYLASSLGLRPTIKVGRATCNGKDCGAKWTVWFSPCGLPVFRLPRKLGKVRSLSAERHTTARMRTVTSVEAADRVPTQCIRVDNDSHLFLVGRGLVPTHNSTTITMNYVTYQVCKDPNVRIIVVSQTADMAKRFLRGIKDRLAGKNAAYAKLQAEFAPDGGFDANSASWTSDAIYVNSEARDSGEATPTVQALGMNGQIYGNRADLIILDDTITGKNAHEFAKQIDWIQREVINRLTYPGGTLLLVGTRLAPVELYSEIQKPEWYGQDEESPWTYLSQPAVLEFADDPEDWTVLAPKSNRPPVSLGSRRLVQQDDNGLYPWHTGKALARRRATSSPQNWAMVYQQEQVSETAIFPTDKVIATIDGGRPAGLMRAGANGHRVYGMDGLHIIGGFDPALTGGSAAVVLGIDRATGIRWVLDVWTKMNQKPEDLFNKIKEMTVKYRINEWAIEKNAMNLMVTQSRDLRNFLGSRGCLLREHYTGNNKNDSDFGVASMSTLFEGALEGEALIRLPSRAQDEGIRSFVEQLTSWFPQSKAKQDTVMALWFAETRARELVDTTESVFHMSNQYATPRDKARRMTVDLDHAALAMASDGSTHVWMG